MAIIGALAKGLAKGGGRAVASNIMGRKKTVKPSAIAPRQGAQGQQQGQRKGSALVKSPTTAITKAMAPIQKVSTGPVAKGDYLAIIHEKVLTIEKIVTGVYKAEKDNLKAEKQAEKDDARKNQEQKLETKDKKPEKKKPSLRQLPKLGVFGWLKRFIGNILMGLFLSKMVDFAGLLPGIVRAIDGITTFLADFGILMVDALTTFADWGIKAYNFTFGAIEKVSSTLFGENADKIVGLIDTALFLTTAIAASMAVESLMGGDDGGGFDPLDLIRRKGAQRAATQTAARGVATKGATAAGAKGTAGIAGGAAATAAAIVAGVGLLSSALGEGAFQLRKIGKGIESGAKERWEKKGPFDIRKPLDWLLYQGARFVNHNLNGLGILFDIVGAPFRYAIELISFGIMALLGDTEGMKKQRKNLAKFDARVREGIRELLNVATLGFAFKDKGSFGNIFGDNEATKEMVSKMQEGGKVEGSGKGKVQRGIKTKKKKRKKLRLARPTREVMQPLPTVDEKKLDPDDVGKNNREWWDFLGWAGTGNAEKPLGQGGKILAEKTTKVGNELGKNDYFGPILRVASKLILDQDITSRDYSNIGRGINLLVDDGLVKNKIGVLGYNQGGLAENLPQLDVTDWVSKTFEDTLRDGLKKKYLPNSSYGSTDGPDSESGARDSASGELDYTSGPAGSSGDALTMARNLMRDLNLTEAQAAGIVGNMIAESGVENARPQNTPSGTKGPLVVDGKTGYGIVQWTSRNRQQELYDFAESKGHDMSKPLTMDLEYQFFLKEFQGSRYGPVLKQIRKAKSVKESSTIFMQQFEVPAGYRTEAKIMERYNMSQPVYKKLSSGKGTATEGKGTYIAPQAPDLSGIEQGELTEASNKLLQDFPQIKSRGSAPQIYASGLGYWLKKNFIPPAKDPHRRGRGDLGDPDGGDMEHPDHGGVVAFHRGTGHKRGVALDLGGDSAGRGGVHKDDQKYMWPYISKFLKQYGLNKHSPYFTLHGTGESFSPVGSKGGSDGGHNDHFHVEFHKGGMVGGSGLVNAVLKTGEMVIDVDSTGPAKNLLLAINQASSREGIIKAIRDYAPYDARAEQTVIVPEESEDVPQVLLSGGSSSTTLLPVLMGSSNPFEFLEYQG